MSKTEKQGFFSRMSRFVKDMIGEMKKVVWPSKKQTVNNTLVVLAFMVFMAVIIGVFDFGVVKLLQLIFGSYIDPTMLGV